MQVPVTSHKMKLVFALYKYFPYGGLQRDMLAIARECAARGHEVEIFCQSWSGDYPEDSTVQVNILKDQRRWWMSAANHRKNHRFHQDLGKALARIRPDCVVGFNRIPGLDVYYAADTCFKAKLYRERPWIYRLLPRYRQFLRDEAALFSPGGATHILAIAQAAMDEYQHFHQTPAERFSLLPPGISRDRINQNAERLWVLHEEFCLEKNTKIVLMVGSGFRTKGLDRAIHALAALPEGLRQQTHLVIVGEDNAAPFVEQAKMLGITGNIHFLGGRKDIPQLLKSADLLIHPAYREAAGMVLLEAAVAGLPLITTEVCGYSPYVKEQQLGIVLPLPFVQQRLNEALTTALTDDVKRKAWHDNGLRFAQAADIYDMPKHAADRIEKIHSLKKGIAL